MRLTIDLPPDHPMRSEVAFSVQARRLLGSRLAELTADLGASPLESVFRAAAEYRLYLDGEALRTRRRGGATGWEPRPSPARRLPDGLAEAEAACALVLDDLLAQRHRLVAVTATWPGEPPSPRVLLPPPVLSMSVAAAGDLDSPFDETSREESLAKFNGSLFPTTGLLLPALTVQVDEDLVSGQFRVALNGVRLPPHFGPCSDEVLVDESPERVRVLVASASVRPCAHPETGSPSALIPADEGLYEACRAAKLRVLTPWGYRFAAALGAIRRQAANFLGDDAVALMLQRTEMIFPRLAQSAATVGDAVLGEVLRGMAEEGVSVRNLWLVLRSLTGLRALTDAEGGGARVVFGPTDGGLGHGRLSGTLSRYGAEDLLAAVRLGLQGELTQQQTRGAGALLALSVALPVERAFARGPTAGEQAAWRQALAHKLAGGIPGARKPVLISSVTARRALWEAIRVEEPDLAVLAYQEVDRRVEIRFLGQVEWNLPPDA